VAKNFKIKSMLKHSHISLQPYDDRPKS